MEDLRISPPAFVGTSTWLSSINIFFMDSVDFIVDIQVSR
jgi:hypothetical protein